MNTGGEYRRDTRKLVIRNGLAVHITFISGKGFAADGNGGSAIRLLGIREFLAQKKDVSADQI